MDVLDLYRDPSALPGSEAGRIGVLLGLAPPQQIDDISLAERVSNGLRPASAETLASLVGRMHVVGPPDSGSNAETRKKENRKALSREMSE